MVVVKTKLLAVLVALALVAAIPAAVHGQGAGVNSRAVAFGSLTCSNTATQILVANPQRVSVLLANNDVVTIFVGVQTVNQGGMASGITPATLSTANGIPVVPGGTITIEGYLDVLFCITASASANMRVWEESR